MNGLNNIFKRIFLGAISSGPVASAFVRLASWYRYVALFV
jgi:hypothetical protein